MKNTIILAILFFPACLLAKEECFHSFIKHHPLWQFWQTKENGGNLYVCSFAEDERWGESPRKKWKRTCVEEVENQMMCDFKSDGIKRAIEDVSEPERTMSEDGILYHRISVQVGETDAQQ